MVYITNIKAILVFEENINQFIVIIHMNTIFLIRRLSIFVNFTLHVNRHIAEFKVLFQFDSHGLLLIFRSML